MIDHQIPRDRLAPLYTKHYRTRAVCEAAAILLGVAVLAACLFLIGLSCVIISSWFR